MRLTARFARSRVLRGQHLGDPGTHLGHLEQTLEHGHRARFHARRIDGKHGVFEGVFRATEQILVVLGELDFALCALVTRKLLAMLLDDLDGTGGVALS